MSKPRHRLKVEKIRITSTEHWLRELRPKDMNASKTGALFDMHPYATPLSLFAEKSGMDLGPDEDTTAMRRGRLLESAVAAAFLEAHPGWRVKKAMTYLRAPEIRLGATPDYRVFDPAGKRGVLQCKTVAPFEFRRSWTDTTAPGWICLQTLTEAMLDGADYGIIAALVVDGWRFDLHEYLVPRHARAERRIIEATEVFWANLTSPEPKPPPVDYTRDGPLLDVIYRTEEPGKVIDLRGDNRMVELVEERERAASRERAAKADKEALDTEIKSKLGDAEAAQLDGWRLSWKTVHVKAEEKSRPAHSYRRIFVARDKLSAKQQEQAA